MMRGHIVDKINEIDDKLFFLREKINRSISDLNTRAVHEASKSIISLISVSYTHLRAHET